MSASAASSRAKTCSLSMSGRVLMSVTGRPRTMRSSGSSAPARRSRVLILLNTVALTDFGTRHREIDAGVGQHLRGNPFSLGEQAEKQMLRTDEPVIEVPRLVPGELQHLLGA